MPDSLKRRGPEDPDRFNPNQEWEVEDMVESIEKQCSKASEDEIREAIETVVSNNKTRNRGALIRLILDELGC